MLPPRDLIALGMFMAAAPAHAQVLLVSGNPASLNVVMATPGLPPTSATDASSTYSVTTLVRSKIAVSISSSMPSGLTLNITLAAPPGAVSSGAIALSTTSHDAVTGIPLGTLLAVAGITYTFTAGVTAGAVTSSSRTVTFTVLLDP